ncbi:MAG: ATP-binding cassette domain-containing protein, partial [Candidatus Caldarchaeum sp.]
MTETILKTRGLTKRFGALTAVDNFDIDVVKNSIHSIIGPNGAGKTTLFNLIPGMVKPDSGSIVF